MEEVDEQGCETRGPCRFNPKRYKLLASKSEFSPSSCLILSSRPIVTDAPHANPFWGRAVSLWGYTKEDHEMRGSKARSKRTASDSMRSPNRSSRS